MSNLIRWDPIRELSSVRDTMDRLFDEGFSRPLSGALWDLSAAPAMDLYQIDDAVVVKMTLPGVKPEDIQVAVANGVLTVRGEIKEEKEEKEKTFHIRERRHGTFSRSVALPIQTNVDKANADFDNGILTLTIPKAEESKAKSITVKARK